MKKIIILMGLLIMMSCKSNMENNRIANVSLKDSPKAFSYSIDQQYIGDDLGVLLQRLTNNDIEQVNFYSDYKMISQKIHTIRECFRQANIEVLSFWIPCSDSKDGVIDLLSNK